MSIRFTCSQCNEAVTKSGGNKGLSLCNKCYIKYRRGEPKTCSSCGRVMKTRRKHEPICAQCEVLTFVQKYYYEQSERFSQVIMDSLEKRKQLYWNFLVEKYGEKKKSIWEAFHPIDTLLTTNVLYLSTTFNELESFRKGRNVREKSAIYVYMEFLGEVGELEKRYDKRYERSYERISFHVSELYRPYFVEYINFCLIKRKLTEWTTYLIADHLRDFFVWLADKYKDPQLREIHEGIIREHLVELKTKFSQKTIYNIYTVLEDFFRWTKMKRLTFINPVSGVYIKAPEARPDALPIAEQKRVVARWLHKDTDPMESAIGMLCLFFGLSSEEISYLKVENIDLESFFLSLPQRNARFPLTEEIIEVLARYLGYRNILLKGAPSEYVFVSRITARYNRPIGRDYSLRKLKAANVNLRALRATCLIEIACSGNIKLLEYLGLSSEGTRPYTRVLEDYIAIKQFDEGLDF